MRHHTLRSLLALTMLTSCIVTPCVAHEIDLIGVGEISGTDVDLSGQTDILKNGSPHNLVGGISALEYSGQGTEYYALPDRGPDDGAVAYHCRYHKLNIDINASTSSVTPSINETVMFTNGTGLPFPGEATAYTSTQTHAVRFDPEGIRLNRQGNIFVSDEYGPRLIEFSLDGKEQREFKIPQRYLIENPGTSKEEENGANTSGRASNRGMEGLALSTDGKFLIGLMQSPLLQDCERSQSGKPKGLNCRLLKIDLQTGATSEYLYHLDSEENKLNEILAINEDEYLVIERDGEPGDKAKFKKVMKINLSLASDIQHIAQLPATALPAGIVPVQKTVYIDMLDPEYKLSGERFPEKLESLTFGPLLADGRQTLLVVSDNDFIQEHSTMFYVFALPVNNKELSALK